jgi:hypothetical protein
MFAPGSSFRNFAGVRRVSIWQMRKPVRISLTVVGTVALACCARKRVDPCNTATFNQEACQQAVQSGGYYWQGSWYPVSYSHPYPYYYDQYHSYVSQGGSVVSPPAAAYSKPSGGVERGGFGASGEGHGEAGAHGAGE